MSGGFTHEAPRAASVEYYTPEWIFRELRLRFDMDVASPEDGPLPWIPAARFITPKEDGLVVPYEGLVWCNPPYGDLTAPFLKRMHEHRNGVALVFARTDTAWFHDYVAKAKAILFLKKRIRFVNRAGKPYGSPGSLLAAWGSEAFEALLGMEQDGLGFFAVGDGK